MRRVLLGLLFLSAAAPLGAASAQTSSALVVPSCTGANAPAMQVGQIYPLTMDPSGRLCGNVAVQGANPAPPAFLYPGPPILSRWRASCNCFTNPP